MRGISGSNIDTTDKLRGRRHTYYACRWQSKSGGIAYKLLKDKKIVARKIGREYKISKTAVANFFPPRRFQTR